jgi:hypothetical protein
MTNIDLGLLEQGPHADLIGALADKCYADDGIQAIWIGGSLASGHGDLYSDIDFRIAVEPGQVDKWANPDWNQYLPLSPVGVILMRFGDRALLHHMVLADGTIVDFYVQDKTQQNPEPNVVVLAARNPELRATIEGFARPAAALVREIDGAVVRQFLVDYWITTHKQMKALARKYDQSAFAGLYMERMALLRAWYMHATGKDIESRMSLHMLGALHKGLMNALSEQQHNILGLPSRTPQETIAVIDAIRTQMAFVGRLLAEKHGFAYPYELEEVVLRTWNAHKASLIAR